MSAMMQIINKGLEKHIYSPVQAKWTPNQLKWEDKHCPQTIVCVFCDTNGQIYPGFSSSVKSDVNSSHFHSALMFQLS